MPDVTDPLASAIELLREGKTQEADDLLVAAKKAADAAAAEARGEKPPAPPRAPEEIIVDLFNTFSSLFGHHPKIEALLTELKAVTAPPPAVPKAA